MSHAYMIFGLDSNLCFPHHTTIYFLVPTRLNQGLYTFANHFVHLPFVSFMLDQYWKIMDFKPTPILSMDFRSENYCGSLVQM